jgi:hypothetical protein
MNFTAANTYFYVASDVVGIGYNPENADMSNPRGEQFGVAFFVVAANSFGDTRQFFVGTERYGVDSPTEAKAIKLAVALTARVAGGKLPVAFDRWAAGRAVYGSDAYVAYGQDEDLALERAEG